MGSNPVNKPSSIVTTGIATPKIQQIIFRGAPEEVGFTLPFVGGIVLCVVILWIGYRYLPMD
jgi:hypothetical protein